MTALHPLQIQAQAVRAKFFPSEPTRLVLLARPKPALLPLLAPESPPVVPEASPETTVRRTEPAPPVTEYGPLILAPVSEYGPWITPRRRGDGTFRLGPLLRIVSDVSGVSIIDIKSDRRQTELVRPRQVFCWLAKRFSLESLPSIGRATGGKDHTTVLHAIRRVGTIAEMIEPPRIDDPKEWAKALLAVKWPSTAGGAR